MPSGRRQYVLSYVDDNGDTVFVARMLWMAHLNVSSTYRIISNLHRMYKVENAWARSCELARAHPI